MRRHEYLRSAILSFVTGLLFAAAGLILHFAVIKPMINDGSTGFEKLVLTAIPTVLYAVALLFIIIGALSLSNEISIERGDDVVAKITGIKEYFYGKSNTDIHYNLFCQWKCPANGRTYKYSLKNLPTNPQSRFPDNKITVRVSRKDPRLHFIEF